MSLLHVVESKKSSSEQETSAKSKSKSLWFMDARVNETAQKRELMQKMARLGGHSM